MFVIEYTRSLGNGRYRDVTLQTQSIQDARDCFHTAKNQTSVVWARYFRVGVEGDIAEWYRD